MALTDIVFKGTAISNELARGNGTLTDIVPKAATDLELARGNIGVFTDIVYQPRVISEITKTLPGASDVRHGVQYGAGGTQFTGTLIVAGQASYYATIAKETSANARGGTGTCAKFSPTSTTSWGYWHLYVPVTAATAFVLNFYHKISTNWNGQLKVTIYDTDQTTVLLSSQSITLTNDAAYHSYISTQVTPTSTGMCLLRLEIIDGSTTGYVFIDDIGIT